MKKLFVFLLMILIFLRVDFLLATDYPISGGDVYVNIKGTSSSSAILHAGDTVGWNTSLGEYSNGLVWCPNGLTAYATDTGAVDFASPLAVQRSMSLSITNTLRLRSDLILQGHIDILNSGLIDGVNNRIILNGPMYLNGNYVNARASSLRFVGNGNTIFFNEGGYINQSTAGLDLEFKNIVLDGLNINNITGDYNLILDDAIIKLDSDFCFNGAGELGIYNDVLVTGTHTFCLDGICKIYDNAQLMFDIGTTFSMGLHSNITMMNNKTGSIYFNDSNITIADSDCSINSGKIIFENEITIDDESNYGNFVIGANTEVDVLGNARIVLENTTTFSIL